MKRALAFLFFVGCHSDPCHDETLRTDGLGERCSHPEHVLVRLDGTWSCQCLGDPDRPVAPLPVEPVEDVEPSKTEPVAEAPKPEPAPELPKECPKFYRHHPSDTPVERIECVCYDIDDPPFTDSDPEDC